jgi:hypothetical protein
MITAPAGPTSLSAGFLRELTYAATCFFLIVLPYRLMVRPPSSSVLVDAVLGRAVLPALVYVLGMMTFILLRAKRRSDANLRSAGAVANSEALASAPGGSARLRQAT